ncbi:MAG: methylated-DNA--[protein]-cysteine S-methyltransferase [Lachnospiraceae bacterium]|nr:methylated-DNA--[protein]-cysteine S-methyltransferase [Lachnospiraceae bacterium]
MTDLTDDIIEELQNKYDFLIERPWRKYPECITLKDPDSEKWFAAFLQASGRSLGFPEKETVPFVNVKAAPDDVIFLTQARGILPAYHMSKKHWISVLTDGTVEMKLILSLIDASYQLITDTPSKRIYQAVRSIPKGKVATYGQIAAMAGNPKMARAVGNALHKNPDGDRTPCYRVVNAAGELAEAFVFGGIHVQQERLEADGIEVIDGKVDLKKYGL